MRYPYLASIQEDLLLCNPLPTTSIGTEIFKLLDEVFAENSILWDHSFDVSRDGANGMNGKMTGII